MMKIDTEMTRDQLEMVSGNGFWGDVGLGSAVGGISGALTTVAAFSVAAGGLVVAPVAGVAVGIGVAGAALGGVVGGVLSETLPEGS